MPAVYTDINFETEVLKADKLTIVDFWAVWCAPCVILGRTMEDLATKYAGKINIGKVNADENPTVSMKYDVRGLPCVLFIKNGEVVDRQIGLAAQRVYEKKIEQHM